jgi:hypothetical protein
MAVTYQSVLGELNNFNLSDAVDRDDAINKVSEFMDKIRPKIDQVIRENPNLSAEEKRKFDEREAAIHGEINTQFPGGGRRRKSRKGSKTRKGRKAHKKSSKSRKH